MEDTYDSCEYILQTGCLIGLQCGKPIKQGAKYCDACFTNDTLQKRYPDNTCGIFFVPIYGYYSANNVCGFVIRDCSKVGVSCTHRDKFCPFCRSRYESLNTMKTAQISTVGQVMSINDMPHLDNGLVPDIVINPQVISKSKRKMGTK